MNWKPPYFDLQVLKKIGTSAFCHEGFPQHRTFRLWRPHLCPTSGLSKASQLKFGFFPHAERAKSTWPWLQIRGDALALKKKVNRRLWFFGGSPPDIGMTNRNYDDARRAALDFATKAGSENVAPLLSTRDLRERMEKGERVVIVPWPFLQVIAVSYLCIDIYTKKASRRHRCVCRQGYTCTQYIYIYIYHVVHSHLHTYGHVYIFLLHSDIVGNIYIYIVKRCLHSATDARLLWATTSTCLPALTLVQMRSRPEDARSDPDTVRPG